MPLVSLMPWRFDRFPKPLTIAPHVFSSSQQPNHGPWLQGSILSFVLPSATFLHIGKLFGMTAAFFFRRSQGMVGKRWPKLLFDEFYVPTPSQFSTIAKYLCRDIFAYRPMLKWTSSGWMPYPLCPLTKTRRSCEDNCDSLPPVPPVSIQTNDMSSFLTYFILSCFCILCCTHPRFVVYCTLSLKICPLDLLYT